MLLRMVTDLIAVVLVGTSVWAAALLPAATASSDQFEVEIRDFYGAEGYTYVYRLRVGGLAVSLENDFGRPAKELCRVPLSAARADEWIRFIASFPLDTLASEYVDPGVDDGLQMTFSVKRGDGTPRIIHVANMFQADLAVLCDRVAAMVPAECARRPLKLPAK